MLMLKGVFWLLVLFSLMGLHFHLLGIVLFLVIAGFVVKSFFAPFKL
jgi:hypothetical protein